MDMETKEQNKTEFQARKVNSGFNGQLETPQLALKKAYPSGFYTKEQVAILEQQIFHDWNQHIDRIFIQGEPLTKILGKSRFDSKNECIKFIKEQLFADVPDSILNKKFLDILSELHKFGLMFAATTAIQSFHDESWGKQGGFPIFVSTYNLRPTVIGFGVEETLTAYYFEQVGGKVIDMGQDPLRLSQLSLFEVDTLKSTVKTIDMTISIPQTKKITGLELYNTKLKLIPDIPTSFITNGFLKNIVGLLGGNYKAAPVKVSTQTINIDALIREIENHIDRFEGIRRRRELKKDYARKDFARIKREFNSKISSIRELIEGSGETVKKLQKINVDEMQRNPLKVIENVYQTANKVMESKCASLTENTTQRLDKLDSDITALRKKIDQIKSFPIKNEHEPHRERLLRSIQDSIKSLEAERFVLHQKEVLIKIGDIEKALKSKWQAFLGARDALMQEHKAIHQSYQEKLSTFSSDQKGFESLLTNLLHFYDVCCSKAENYGISWDIRSRLYLLLVSVNQLKALKAHARSGEDISALNDKIEKIKSILPPLISRTLQEQPKIEPDFYFNLLSKDIPVAADLEDFMTIAVSEYESYQRVVEVLAQKYTDLKQTFEEEARDLVGQVKDLALPLASKDGMPKINADFELLDKASLTYCKKKVAERLNNYAFPRMFMGINRHFKEQAKTLSERVKQAESREAITRLLEAELRGYPEAIDYKAAIFECGKILQVPDTEQTYDFKLA